jgi:hypothetical protein
MSSADPQVGADGERGGVVANLIGRHFVNSTQLWSVELFFFCMVIHLWDKFFMADIPGLRALPRHLGVHRIIWRTDTTRQSSQTRLPTKDIP